QRIPSVVESSGDSWRLNRREAVVGMGAVIGNVALTTWPQSKPSIWPLPVANALNGVANWWLQRRGGYQAAVASNGMFSFLYGRRANARLYNVPTRS
ncbi:MAG TPA: hypothetical protein VLF62_04930, partial [Candidatus Saccharimonadales bacterium]|nr:hypothetical protein [Candidatus Saccharimonadales bacterium]